MEMRIWSFAHFVVVAVVVVLYGLQLRFQFILQENWELLEYDLGIVLLTRKCLKSWDVNFQLQGRYNCALRK